MILSEVLLVIIFCSSREESQRQVDGEEEPPAAVGGGWFPTLGAEINERKPQGTGDFNWYNTVTVHSLAIGKQLLPEAP